MPLDNTSGNPQSREGEIGTTKEVVVGDRRTQEALDEILTQARLTNLYLSTLVGEVFTCDDLEDDDS
jgi:hypothetical protein